MPTSQSCDIYYMLSRIILICQKALAKYCTIEYNNRSEKRYTFCIQYVCRCVGIGRRGGLKIHCQRWRAGSSPATGTRLGQARKCLVFRHFWAFLFAHSGPRNSEGHSFVLNLSSNFIGTSEEHWVCRDGIYTDDRIGGVNFGAEIQVGINV